MKIVSNKIRESANGKGCTINIVGVCNYDDAKTVLCHFPDNSNGTGKKSDDISGGYGCSDCHQVVDGLVKCDEYRLNRHFYMRRSQTRTLRSLIEDGIVIIKGFTVT